MKGPGIRRGLVGPMGLYDSIAIHTTYMHHEISGTPHCIPCDFRFSSKVYLQ